MDTSNLNSIGSVLVELFHFRDKLRIFAIRSDLKQPKVITQTLSSEELDEIFREFLHALFVSTGEWITSPWKRLSELICRPLQPYFKERDRIIFVPHRIFHYLPLHLLILNGRTLIEDHAVVYSPSASVLQYCQQKNPKRINPLFRPLSLVAFGLDFENEAEVVAKCFRSAKVIRSSDHPITKELISSACQHADVIHFSGHGEFHFGDVERSGLVLPASSEQGGDERMVFSLHDVYNLQLDSYIVTLGACNSGLGDYKTGDEILGITRGFFCAGTPTIMASLWPVPNEATVALMEAFYSHLLDDGLDKADSLRIAQMQIRKRFSSPLEWGGFTMIGDWL